MHPLIFGYSIFDSLTYISQLLISSNEVLEGKSLNPKGIEFQTNPRIQSISTTHFSLFLNPLDLVVLFLSRFPLLTSPQKWA